MKKPITLLIIALVLGASSLFLHAAPPADQPIVLAYQGYLEKGGTPFSGTLATLTLSVTPSSPSWTQTFTDVPVSAGRFTVLLGGPDVPGGPNHTLPPSLFVSGVPLSVNVTVEGTSLGTQQLLPTAFSVTAARANQSAGDFTVNGALSVTSTAAVSGALSVGGNAGVTGSATVNGALNLPTFPGTINGGPSVPGGSKVVTVNDMLNVGTSITTPKVTVNNLDVSKYLFGGMYCTDIGIPGGGNPGGEMSIRKNPFTNGFSCPAGFAAQPLFNTGDVSTCSGTCGGFRCFFCAHSPVDFPQAAL
jgi:hypothetical protein